jgi:hypothetical protein
MAREMTIEHRDALIYMLSEAAELEHAIMCQYLYAAFSLKTSVDEGVDERQLRSIQRCKKAVLGVATEEMLHLALVNNLLAAVGAAPRVGRPNLPQRGRYYPPGVELALEPFSEAALRHFLFLERPEGINLQDAEGFAALQEAEPLMSEREIVPRPQHSTRSASYTGQWRAASTGWSPATANGGLSSAPSVPRRRPPTSAGPT